MEEKVCLVQMPFAAATTPSPALSLLKSELTKSGIKSWIEYANLRFLQRVGVKTYRLFSINMKSVHMIGEALFAKATGLPFHHTMSEYCHWLKKKPADIFLPGQMAFFLEKLPFLSADAEEFAAQEAQRIIAQEPRIVACVSMFFQVNATIALLRKVKELRPDIVTIVGGANCMGASGAVLTNQVEWVDYAFSGEADECFAALCRKLLHDKDAQQSDLPYGAMKKGAFFPAGKLPCRITADVDAMAIPDFTDYFQTFDELGLAAKIEPALTVEFSRGCWWGERHACSFCGLNGKINRYRAKSPHRVLREIETLAKQYGRTDFVLTDNILSYRHLKEVVPALVQSRYRFFTEIKSNLKREEIALLKEAGFLWLQPGIESLQDDCLKLMNKGNRAMRHVELLKNCKIYGIHLFWNLLCGFPGEKTAWYDEMSAWIEKIAHFQPPNSLRSIVVQRYNAYWREPEKYGLTLRPAPIYEYVYPALDGFIEHTAYQFAPVEEEAQRKSENPALYGKAYAKLQAQIALWNYDEESAPQRLTMTDDGTAIEIMDLRRIAKKSLYCLRGVQADVYRTCEQAVTLEKLLHVLSDRYEKKEVENAVRKLEKESLLLRIGNEILALAVANSAPRRTADFPGYYKC